MKAGLVKEYVEIRDFRGAARRQAEGRPVRVRSEGYERKKYPLAPAGTGSLTEKRHGAEATGLPAKNSTTRVLRTVLS